MSVPKELIQEFEVDAPPPVTHPGYDCDVCGEHFEGEPAGGHVDRHRGGSRRRGLGRARCR